MKTLIEKRYLFSLEKSEVWQLTKELVIIIYKISKNLLASAQYGLMSQMSRVAISVASNLAEGSSRMARKDQAHCSQIAYGSLMEVACQLNIAEELGFINKEKYVERRRSIVILSGKIKILRRLQKERIK
jgi:four helix bundle protein